MCHPKRFSSLLVAALVLAASSASSYAVIVDVARYRLGEAGSLPGGFPTDSLSSDVFVNLFVNPGVVTGPSSVYIPPGSTAALGFDGAQRGYYTVSGAGVFGASTLGVTPDNFGLELFVKAAPGQVNNTFFTSNGGTNGITFSVDNGNWAAHYAGTSWIGAASGVGQPISPYWTSLAVIRDSGVSTLYINGVAQSGTPGTVPVINGNAHLAVSPGGWLVVSGQLR